MPFLAYIAIVVVGLSTILLELDWLTSPSAANKPTAKIASTAVPPRALEPVAKVDGPNAQLSPVFPTNPNTAEQPAAPAPVAQTAPAPQPVAQPSANACNFQACTSTYQSFRAFDCSYQPLDGGARRACAVSPDASRRIASTPDGKAEPAAAGRLQSRVEVRRKAADLEDAVHRVKGLTDVDGDDDGPPVESRVILLRRNGTPW